MEQIKNLYQSVSLQNDQILFVDLIFTFTKDYNWYLVLEETYFAFSKIRYHVLISPLEPTFLFPIKVIHTNKTEINKMSYIYVLENMEIYTSTDR